MKALNGIESCCREYEKCLSVGRRKGGNNINNAWQHFICIYFYTCKIGSPTLIVFSKFPNTCIFIMPRKCSNHPVRFYFVCGKFTSKEEQRNITRDIEKIYTIYFGCPFSHSRVRKNISCNI